MNDIEKRAVVLTRELPFARERIWTAMTHPDHVNRWWGPDGFRNEDMVMDFRVGGHPVVRHVAAGQVGCQFAESAVGAQQRPGREP